MKKNKNTVYIYICDNEKSRMIAKKSFSNKITLIFFYLEMLYKKKKKKIEGNNKK